MNLCMNEVNNLPTPILQHVWGYYVFTPVDKEELQTAVNMWQNDIKKAIEIYGHIMFWDVSNISNMNGLFRDYKGHLDLSLWNVSGVTNMSNMFYCYEGTIDVSTWDVSSVTDMSYMFYMGKVNPNVTNWNVSNVITMESMFEYNEHFDKDISKWNVSNVTNMASMLRDTIFNGDISEWDVSSVTNMCSMFNLSKFNQNISKWNIDNVVNMSYMFYCCKYTQSLNWTINITKVNIIEMFDNKTIYENCWLYKKCSVNLYSIHYNNDRRWNHNYIHNYYRWCFKERLSEKYRPINISAPKDVFIIRTVDEQKGLINITSRAFDVPECFGTKLKWYELDYVLSSDMYEMNMSLKSFITKN